MKIAPVADPVGARVHYGSEQFTIATQVIQRLRRAHWYKALCDPSWYGQACSALLTLWRLPRADLILSASESKTWFADYFPPAGRKLAGSRWGQAVLRIEDKPERYLLGRAKQALRTNLHHAKKAGIKVARVSYRAFDAAARQILTVRRGAPDHTLAPAAPNHQCVYYVATDGGDLPLVFGGVANFGNFGVLFVMFSDPQHPDAAFGRYLTHTELVTDLAQRGSKYLLCGPAFNQTAGEQYFHHLLGYRACNLHYHITPGPNQGRLLARKSRSTSLALGEGIRWFLDFDGFGM